MLSLYCFPYIPLPSRIEINLIRTSPNILCSTVFFLQLLVLQWLRNQVGSKSVASCVHTMTWEPRAALWHITCGSLNDFG